MMKKTLKDGSQIELEFDAKKLATFVVTKGENRIVFDRETFMGVVDYIADIFGMIDIIRLLHDTIKDPDPKGGPYQ